MSLPTIKRSVAVFALGLLAIAALGAKCIEHDQMYTDSEGYTHIVGEMVNETDVSATTVTLSGKLFDAQGNVLAETTGKPCPESVQPQNRQVFDLKFPNPNIANIDHYEVRPIAGTTIPGRLPDAHMFLIRFYARRIGPLVLFLGQVRNDSGQTWTELKGCTAVYNNQGKVIRVEEYPIFGDFTPGAALLYEGAIEDVPEDAVQFRVWVATGNGTEWIASNKVTIE